MDLQCGATLPVLFAGITHEDCFLLDHMPSLRSGCAWINSVLVIQASADRVFLKDLDAHYA